MALAQPNQPLHTMQFATPTLRVLRPSALGLTVLGLALLQGCSTFQEEKVDYTSAKRTNSLEVPPDLSQLSRETRFAVPGSVVTASGYQASAPQATVTVAATEVGDVRIERAGTERWLVVKRPPEKLWQPVRDFWQENGFVFNVEQQQLGLLETDWAENRAKLPQDFIRNTLGKLMDSLYSTGERDKFRTRLERGANGETEIYISHRGLIEVYADNRKEQTVWQPRPADPALEAEFLRRLMIKLGVTEQAAKAQMNAQSAPPKARLVGEGSDQMAVELSDTFDRAWRRVGVALDRSGFTVEDRDRAKGLYFVRYVEAVDKAAEPGILSKLFGATKTEAKPAQYQIRVSEGRSQSAILVTVLDAKGNPDQTATRDRILKLLASDLQ